MKVPENPILLAERLRIVGEKTTAFFLTLSNGQWSKIIYTDHVEWTIYDVLAHFVSTEISLIHLFDNINNGRSGTPVDFSIDKFNMKEVVELHKFSPYELLNKFSIAREQMITWVSSLSELDLLKKGRHPFLGWTILAEMIKMVYLHNQIHCRDMHRVLDS